MQHRKKIEEIYNSFINGQLKQMVEQIDEYGLYDVWADIREYLLEIFERDSWFDTEFAFVDMVVKYHRIKHR